MAGGEESKCFSGTRSQLRREFASCLCFTSITVRVNCLISSASIAIALSEHACVCTLPKDVFMGSDTGVVFDFGLAD